VGSCRWHSIFCNYCLSFRLHYDASKILSPETDEPSCPHLITPLTPTSVCAVTTRLQSINCMNWIYSHSRIDEAATVGSCKINRLLFADDLVLLVSSQHGLQHALDRFSVACEQVGSKTSAKNRVLCLSRKAKQCLLQMSRNTLAFTSDGTSTLTHELV